MPDADQLFGSASAPAPTGNADELFGGSREQQQAPSALGQSRAVLPQAPTKDALASATAGAATPPTPEDIKRNKVDRSGGPWDLENKLRGFFGAPKVGENEEFDKVSAADSPFPEAAPVVLGKAATMALASAAKGTINAVTNKAAGISALGNIASRLGDPIAKISDSLYTLSKAAQGMKMQWLVDVKNFLPKDYSTHAEDIYHSFEDDSIKLSPRAQYIKDKMVAPIMAKNEKMRDMITILTGEKGPDVEKYVGRIPVGQSSVVDTIKGVLPPNQPKGISTFAPEMQARKVFGMEGAGEKDLHLVQSKNNNSFEVYRGGKVMGSGKLGADDLANKQVKFMGETFKLTDSTTKAIEANTPIRYYHDPLLSAINGNINLSEALHNAQFLEQIKHSPEFKTLVSPKAAEAPEGFRAVNGIPQLAGYKFAPRVANILDDYSGIDKGGALAKLGNITRVTVGSLFWNPLPHIANVLDHKMIEGGLVGNLKALTIDLPSTVKTALAAHKEVMTMGPLYRQALKQGAGLIYPSVVTRNFAESMAQQLGTAPEMDAVAKAWGYANPANMVKAIYAYSAKSLWSWNDVIMMHGYMAKMNGGMGLDEAITQTEKHIPNYRIPDQITDLPGGRAASQFLKSPAVTAFGRYDYGRLASYGNMVKDLVSRDSSIADRAHAIDQMAMLATASLVVYPALDQLVQKVTGNDNASLRRFGADSVPDAIYKFSTGDKTWGGLMSSVMPISPALKVPVELMTGTDTFTGKKIGQDESVGHYLTQQVSPIGQVTDVASGKRGAGQMLLSQVGINSPTQKQMDARAKAKAADERRKARSQQ